MKIVYIGFNHELSHITSAVRSIDEKHDISIDVYARTPESIPDSDAVDEFLQSAGSADIVLTHLMGGRTSLPGLDPILASFGGRDIPVFVASVPFDDEFVTLSTVDADKYDTIHQYLKCGEAENFENLLLFLTNYCTDRTLNSQSPENGFPWRASITPGRGTSPLWMTIWRNIIRRTSRQWAFSAVITRQSPGIQGTSKVWWMQSRPGAPMRLSSSFRRPTPPQKIWAGWSTIF